MEEKFIEDGKRQYLNDFIFRDSSVTLAMSDRISELDVHSLSITREKVFGDANSRMGLKKIVNPPYFLEKNAKYIDKSVECPGCLYIENPAGMKVAFDENFKMTGIVKKTSFFTVKQRLGDDMLIESSDRAILINRDGRPLNNIPLTNNAFVIGPYLLDYRDKSLVVLPRE